MRRILTNKPTTGNIVSLVAGVVLAVIIIIIWSLLRPASFSEISGDTVLDSETITIPAPFIQARDNSDNTTDDRQPSPPSAEEITDISHEDETVSNSYPVFSQHKTMLSSTQRAAIEKGSPLLSVILTGVGSSAKVNDSLIEKLSNNVTISLSPYLKDYNVIATKFNDYGFETWMDIASITYEQNRDHGDLALNPVNTLDHNLGLLKRQLDNKDMVTGVILPAQSLIVETQDLWENIVSALFMDGYGIVDNTSQVMKPALFFYNDQRAPYIKGDQNLSDNLTLDQYKQALSGIRKSVREQNTMVVSIPVLSPAALDIFADWVDSLANEGITLVPVSAQAKLN